MKLAKPRFDVGLMTDDLDPMLAFWQGPVGLPLQEVLPTGGGNRQHRHGLLGSVFKLNHTRQLAASPPGGYRELVIARDGIDTAQRLTDPDGNRVSVVAPGADGIERIAMRVAVRDPRVHAAFYEDALGLERLSDRMFRCGDSQLWLEADPDAAVVEGLAGRGYRYLTIQVFDCEAEHRQALERGAGEGAPPRRAGDVAIFSMVCDPDGNWIEISQRASLTGSLD